MALKSKENYSPPEKLLNLFFHHITDPFVPLYTLEELQQKIEKFIQFLNNHKDEIISTGSTRHNFYESMWMDLRLKALYNFSSKQNVLVTNFKNNTREIISTSATETPNIFPILNSEIKSAIILKRSELFSLKLQSLKILCANTNVDMVTSQLQNLIDFNFSNSIKDFCKNLEKLYKDSLTQKLTKSDLSYSIFNGGIQDIAYFCMHVLKELHVKTYANLKQSIQNAKFLPNEKSFKHENEHRIVEKLFGDFKENLRKENSVWHLYDDRIRKPMLDIPGNIKLCFDGKINTNVLTPIRISFNREGKINDYLASFSDLVKEMEKISGEPFVVYITPDSNTELFDIGASNHTAEFRFSPDYRCINFKGKMYSLTTNQAQVLEILHRNYLNRTPEISQAYLLEDLNAPATSRLRDIFRKSEAWGTLVVQGKSKGSYKLNLDYQ